MEYDLQYLLINMFNSLQRNEIVLEQLNRNLVVVSEKLDVIIENSSKHDKKIGGLPDMPIPPRPGSKLNRFDVPDENNDDEINEGDDDKEGNDKGYRIRERKR